MKIADPQLAERYELRRRIGSGGMGDVYEALDRDTGEVVALKTLVRADADTLFRFKREFRALQSTAHPNLVSLRELVRDGEQWFFTMELVKGSHFLEYTRGDHGRLRDGLGQLVVGLRALHQAGLIHRDIKPSNVMVTDEGRVVLLDFGLVTPLDPAGQSRQGHAVGTVEYMAPEQAVGRTIGESADWYSIGVMLYEALTGQMPHAGHALQILIDKQQVVPAPVQQRAPDAPPDLAALCDDLLRIEPATRPTGREIVSRLGVVDGEPVRDSTRSFRSASGVFVGREREQGELAASRERATDRAVVHLVVGESGIGKSELMSHFVRSIADADPDALVLHGRCYERESVPYKALDGVADGLAQHLSGLTPAEVAGLLPPRAALLVRLFPVFLRNDSIASAPFVDEGGDPQEQRRRMFRALRGLLSRVTERRRVVITIDDLQWADADSFLLLRELLRGPNSVPVLVLATARPSGPHAEPIEARLDGLVVARTDLGPLSEDECRVLAEQLAPTGLGAIDIARVSREVGGHPMFLQEILRHLDVSGAPTSTLDDALLARAARLRPDAHTLLEVVCVAGAPIGAEVAAAASRLDPTALGRAAASLRVAGLVRELHRGRGLALEPYHDRVREAVQGRLSTPARRDLHARLAAALEGSGEARDPQLLLRHFRLAELPDRAARYAEEAALRSLDAHAFDQAAELWRNALELVPRSVDDRRRLLIRLGEALIAAGRGAEAAEVHLEAAVGADRATRLDCQRHAAEQLLISGRITRGVAALEEVLGEVGEGVPATPRRALASLLRHRLQLRLRGFRFTERHRREIADAELLKLELLRGAAHGLALVDSIRGADFQTRHLLLALKIGHRTDIAQAVLTEAIYQSTHGNIVWAQKLRERGLAIGGEHLDLAAQTMAHGARATIAYFSGDARGCIEHMALAEASARQVLGQNWQVSTCKLFTMYALRFIGDYNEMRRRYHQYHAEAVEKGDLYLDSSMRRVCVPMWLADDAPAEAARELERATWVPDTASYHVQHFHELIARGEIALYTGEPADRARLADGFARLGGSMLLRIASIRTQHAYLRGRLAIVADDLRQAERHARELAKVDNPVAQVWALLVRAGVAVAGGDRALAAEILDEAEAGAVAAEMLLTTAAVRRRLAELRDLPELEAAATVDMDALGIRAPGRMTALLVPFGP